MPSAHSFEIAYRFNNDPRSHRTDSHENALPVHVAASQLIELHFADAENSLVMPAPDAAPAEIMAQAETLGITNISVNRA
ncbi:hypothetical protein [Pseudomonas sp. EA_35y_Pfl2_R5]|uniref:hypothetical protein n=1 Tax=Pseudomonas sp. EA_35y_Pfl2_R5 TaxID=3088690 RepID=UPI0030D8D58A